MRLDAHTPAALLAAADLHFRSLQPAQRAHFQLDGRAYRARFEYPGVVLVFDGASGAQLARSMPGSPTVPAQPLTALARP